MMNLKTIRLSLLFLMTLLVSSCGMHLLDGIDGEGPIVQKEYNLTKTFHAVKATSGWEVELIRSNHPRIAVRTERNLIPIFRYKIEQGTLRIFNEKNIGNSESREVKIYYRNLSKIQASSGSELFSSEVFHQKEMNLSTSSGAEMKLQLKCKNTTASTSSGAEMELKGTSINFNGRASSGSALDAKELKTKNCEVKASSGASIKTQVIKSLRASTSSGGEIEYTGNPKTTHLKKSISGGEIEQED